MNVNEKNSFLLYVNFGKQVRMLTMEERGELITAIFDHEEYGHAKGTLSPRVELVFSFIEDALERDRMAYEKRCEQNRENGKRGGRPRKNADESDRPFFGEKTERLSKEAEKADNDNENDNENDNDNGNENDSDNENENTLALSGAEPPGAEPPRAEPPRAEPPWAEPPRAEPLGTPCPIAQKDFGFLGNVEYAVLISEGIDGAYVRQKEARAKEYSIRHSVSVANVLREWWRKDTENKDVHAKSTASRDKTSKRGKSSEREKTVLHDKSAELEKAVHHGKSSERGSSAGHAEYGVAGELGCSFDTDDFLQAALEKSMRPWESDLLSR